MQPRMLVGGRAARRVREGAGGTEAIAAVVQTFAPTREVVRPRAGGPTCPFELLGRARKSARLGGLVSHCWRR